MTGYYMNRVYEQGICTGYKIELCKIELVNLAALFYLHLLLYFLLLLPRPRAGLRHQGQGLRRGQRQS
jgi:hypothetical protein